MAQDQAEIDLAGRPMTIHSLHVLLNTICGMPVTIVKNAARETAAEIFSRVELAIIAAHEARVRQARERG